MTIETYPTSPAPSFSQIIEEAFQTIISKGDSGVAERNAIVRFPERIATLVYERNEDADFAGIHSFFRKRRGGFDPFWFFDLKKRLWVDEFVGVGGLIPLAAAIADDGGVQTDETTGANDATANDMTLLPAVPAVTDRYHFMSNFQFDTIRLNIGTPGVGTWTITFKYSKADGTYAALSGVTDGTTGFKAAAGNHDVTFTVPTDWAIIEVDGINGYDIVAEVTAYTSITTQPKGTQAWVSSKVFELPAKTVTDDATLITYVDDVVTAKTFISGGGAGSADRFSLSATPADGSLVTADLTGYLRILGYLDDSLKYELYDEDLHRFESVRINEIKRTLTPV